jgi:hypothetical protein
MNLEREICSKCAISWKRTGFIYLIGKCGILGKFRLACFAKGKLDSGEAIGYVTELLKHRSFLIKEFN